MIKFRDYRYTCCLLLLSSDDFIFNDDCIYLHGPIIMQKKMKETECTLADLEERYMQANDTIKEKQYLIENLLKSGYNLSYQGHLIIIKTIDFCVSVHTK